MEPKISMIVAIDSKSGMGKSNSIPWNLPQDLARFRKLTKGHTIIMGRKTWDSLPRKPLPDRINMIVTRSLDIKVPNGVSINNSLEEAIVEAKEHEQEEIFIIGGAQIFAQAIEKGIVDRLYLTEIKADFDCDTFFPEYSEFNKIINEESHEENGIKFKYIDLEKSS